MLTNMKAQSVCTSVSRSTYTGLHERKDRLGFGSNEGEVSHCNSVLIARGSHSQRGLLREPPCALFLLYTLGYLRVNLWQTAKSCVPCAGGVQYRNTDSWTVCTKSITAQPRNAGFNVGHKIGGSNTDAGEVARISHLVASRSNDGFVCYTLLESRMTSYGIGHSQRSTVFQASIMGCVVAFILDSTCLITGGLEQVSSSGNPLLLPYTLITMSIYLAAILGLGAPKIHIRVRQLPLDTCISRAGNRIQLGREGAIACNKTASPISIRDHSQNKCD